MSFTSVSYFLFLPVVYLVFQLCPDRWRWLVLLLASYAFYLSLRAPYLPCVLLAVTLISFSCGGRIAASSEESVRKRWLWIGSVSTLTMLAAFKYLPVVAARAGGVPGLDSVFPPTLVSVGVSYFTFQAVSYLADVYLELEEPEPHFGRFALYLAFFPKLLQGPIERAGSLLPQLSKPFSFDHEALRSGALLFAWGFFKKVALADRLSLYADQVYNNVHAHQGISLIAGTYAYALQLYFDFAGYTDMARGVARVFGVELTANFNSPYLATSIADFWRRWHISFSRWILDYIFKPLQLGWRNMGKAGTAWALLVAFTISGLWHGASWGFLVWGLLHGTYLACSTYYQPYKKRLYQRLGVEKSEWLRWWQIFITFNLVSLGWVFFRANSVADARYLISHCLTGTRGFTQLLYAHGHTEFHLTVVALGLYLVAKRLPCALENLPRHWATQPFKRHAIYQLLLVATFFLASYSAGRTFVYFQF